MTRYWDWFGDGSVVVADIGLACCVVEFEAAAVGRPMVAEPGTHATVAVVVSGTVTDAVAPAVASVVADQPGRAVVVSFGACACSGGPYWDSPVVTKGIDQFIEVDHYLPGCPPPPGSLTEVLERL